MSTSETSTRFPKLNSTNYASWAKNMKGYLMEKGHWPAVMGILKEPASSEAEKHATWQDKMWQAAGCIIMALDSDQQMLVEDFSEKPKELWEAIRKIHSVKKAGALYNAVNSLMSVTKEESESLPDLVVKVEKAFEKIKESRPDKYTIEQMDNDLRCIALIRALPSEYNHLASILLQNDALTKEKIMEAFRNEELQKSSQAEAANRVQVGSSRGHGGSRGGFRGGYGGGGRGRGGGFSNSTKVCFLCQKPGHFVSACPDKTKPSGGNGSAHRAEEGKQESAGTASAFANFEAMDFSNTILHWNTDTGATSHMTPNRHWIRGLTPYRVPIRLADNRVIYSEGIGSIIFRPIINGRLGHDIEITRVLYVPLLKNNLLAVLYLTSEQGFNVHITNSTMNFSRAGEVLFTATINKDRVGYLNGATLDVEEKLSLASTVPRNLDLWHRRLAHHNLAGVTEMFNKGLVDGMAIDSNEKPDPICEPCLAGKMHSNPFSSSENRAKLPCDLIHSDVHAVSDISKQGFKYWVTFIDDYSRYRAIIPIKNKSDVMEAFKKYQAWAETQTGRKIKALRDDKGGEYMSKAFEDYLAQHGIERQHSAHNRPQQNGVAERTNWTINERIISMLFEAGLSKGYWVEALAVLTYVYNRSSSSAVPNSTPYERWCGKKPDISNLRVWGSVAYVYIQRDKRKNLEDHFKKYVFIGYPAGYKAWEFMDPTTGKKIICERAEFDERFNWKGSMLKVQAAAPPEANSPMPDTQPDEVHLPAPVAKPPPVQVNNTPLNTVDAGTDRLESPDPLDTLGDDADDEIDKEELKEEEEPQESDQDRSPSPPPVKLPNPRKRWTRELRNLGITENEPDGNGNDDEEPIGRRKKARLNTPTGPNPEPGNYLDMRSSQPIDSESEEEEEVNKASSESNNEGMAQDIHMAEPQTWKQAMKSPQADKWREAADEEISAMLENQVWDIVKCPPGVVPIQSKWVFKIKPKADGSIERFKARIVAKGFSQRPGIDFFETFAATMKMGSYRLIMCIAAIEDLYLHSIDISHAFINSTIDTDIYMVQPDGYVQHGLDFVCKLRKSLYGLRQSPRLWSEDLGSKLVGIGFKRTYSDASIFIYERNGVRIIVPVFVDDIIIAAKCKATTDTVVKELAKHYKLRDLGETTFFLGVEIMRKRGERKLALSQKQYIINKLNEFNMADCKPVGTPMQPGLRLGKKHSPNTQKELEAMRDIPYISAVGSLLYLAIMTRPDIAYTVSNLARFNSNPGMKHWQAVKWLFRYLKGTMDLKLVYGPDPKHTDRFVTYCDADLGGNIDNGKSTTGWMVKMGRGVFNWSSKLQGVVTKSTPEAEYIAAATAGSEIKWVRNLLGELGYGVTGPSKLYSDNQPAIQVAKNPEHHGRMKQLDLSYFFLREEVVMNRIEVIHCPTQEMPADLLTKALPRAAVERCREEMGLTMEW